MTRDPFQPGAHAILRWDERREAHLLEHLHTRERYWVDLGRGGHSIVGSVATIPSAHRIYDDLYTSQQHTLSSPGTNPAQRHTQTHQQQRHHGRGSAPRPRRNAR